MNRVAQHAGLVCGGFLLSFAAIYFAVPVDRAALDRLVSNCADDLSPSHRSLHAADRLREALKSNFVLANEWEATLSAVPEADLARVAGEQAPEFWKMKPLGTSTAYRIFGALGRHNPAAALTQAVEVFGKKEIDGETGQACLRWAVMGIYENPPGPAIEPQFARCPRELWAGLIQGAIGGSDAGSVGEDMRRFQALLTRLLDPETNKENKARFDELQQSVLDAWIERNPLAVVDWLQTPEGKPFEGLLSRALATATIGKPAELIRWATDPRSNLKMPALAKACYGSGADAAAISTLASKLPKAQRQDFLAAYAQAVKEGSPRALVDFVETASPDLLTEDAANVLALPILNLAPRLFDKLTAHMAAFESGEMLATSYFLCEEGIENSSAPSEEASILYLDRWRGLSTLSEHALSEVAATDLDKALGVAARAQKDQQARLTAAVYRARASHLFEEGASIDELMKLAKEAPPELVQGVSEDIMIDLARKNPSECMEVLTERFPKDEKIWKTLFLGKMESGSDCLNAEQMNSFLQQAIKKGVDPAAYSVAAQGMVMQFAMQNLGEARAAVEALPDPKVKEACTAALVKTWGKTDPFEAMTYIHSLADDHLRDAAIEALLPCLKFAPEKQEKLLAISSSETVRQSLRAQMLALPKTSPP